MVGRLIVLFRVSCRRLKEDSWNGVVFVTIRFDLEGNATATKSSFLTGDVLLLLRV